MTMTQAEAMLKMSEEIYNLKAENQELRSEIKTLQRQKRTLLKTLEYSILTDGVKEDV